VILKIRCWQVDQSVTWLTANWFFSTLGMCRGCWYHSISFWLWILKCLVSLVAIM